MKELLICVAMFASICLAHFSKVSIKPTKIKPTQIDLYVEKEPYWKKFVLVN